MTFEQPGRYRIRVQGRLDEKWAGFFDDMTVTTLTGAAGHPVTELTGELIDQAALQGVLQKLYNLGFPLISVEHLCNGTPGEGRTDSL
jgi:hypothetical protein